MQDNLLINDLRQIQYPFGGNDWTFKVGQEIRSISATITRIYLDTPYYSSMGIERFIIEVDSKRSGTIEPWRIVRFLDNGKVSVIELTI